MNRQILTPRMQRRHSRFWNQSIWDPLLMFLWIPGRLEYKTIHDFWKCHGHCIELMLGKVKTI